MMEEVIKKVKVIALVHCPCRATAQLIGKKQMRPFSGELHQI